MSIVLFCLCFRPLFFLCLSRSCYFSPFFSSTVNWLFFLAPHSFATPSESGLVVGDYGVCAVDFWGWCFTLGYIK